MHSIKFDLDKLHPDHRQPVVDMLAYKVLSDEQIEQIYKLYVDLNKHPKKDWSKVVDENKK